jgi:hypothetical protein
MQDILVLYCQRRNIAYSAVLSRLLSPLLAVPDRASRTLASSCFYTVASTFAPLINLNVSGIFMSHFGFCSQCKAAQFATSYG